MPIQHASDKVLRRMGRRTSRDEIKKLIRKLQEMIREITDKSVGIQKQEAENKLKAAAVDLDRVRDIICFRPR